VRIFAAHFVESCVNFGKLCVNFGKVCFNCVEPCADPRSQLTKFGLGSYCQHHDVGASGRLFRIVGDDLGHC